VVGGYRIPFYQHGISLDLIGSYSNSKIESPNASGQTFTGKGLYLGTRINQALASIGEYRHKLIYGLDYKDFDNENNGLSNWAGTVTSTPLSVSYAAQFANPSLQLSGTLTYASNLGFGPHSSQTEHYDKEASGKTPTASVNWDVWRASGTLAMPLPEDWQLRLNVSAQTTSKRMLNAEAFGVGGANSVRGYAERAVSGDTGYVANLEFYTPDFGKLVDDTIKARGVFFIDQGEVRQINDALPPITLRSIGLGLRLNYGKDLAVKADLGFSQTPSAFQNVGKPILTMPQKQAYGLKPIADHWGLHVSATYTF
jgi:hemolysin activation/secretion protein